MQKFILLLFTASVFITACEKPGTENTDSSSTPLVLDYMEVEEHLHGADLYLYGNFGDSSPASKVKIHNTIIDGNPTADGVIFAWSPSQIKLGIGDPDDNTAGGNVTVFNGEKQSNKRVLNVWEISMLYREPDEGTILKEVRFKAFLRADADKHKNIPTLSMPSSFSSISEAYWTIGGQGHSSYPGGGMTISLENRNGIAFWSKPYRDEANAEKSFQSEVVFKNGAFELTGLRMHKKNATKISSLADGSPQPYITDYNFNVEVLPVNEMLKLGLDDKQAIKAGTFTSGPHGTQYDFSWDASEAINHMHNFTLQWSKAEPRFK